MSATVKKFAIGAFALTAFGAAAFATNAHEPAANAASSAQSAIVTQFFTDVAAEMTRPVQARAVPNPSDQNPVAHVAAAMDTPAGYLYPVSVRWENTSTVRLKAGVVRHCADWITTYNTGPVSNEFTCWDLTLKNKRVHTATPHGTDQNRG